MATGTPGTTARQYHTSQVHYLRKAITFGDTAAVNVGIIPAGAVVIDAGVVVSTSFNGTTPTLNIGPVGDPDGYASAISLGTVGKVGADELATSDDLYVTADTTITATPALTSATTGVGVVYVTYLVNN